MTDYTYRCRYCDAEQQTTLYPTGASVTALGALIREHYAAAHPGVEPGRERQESITGGSGSVMECDR